MPYRPTDSASLAQGSPARREPTAEPRDQPLMVALRIRPLNDTELEEGAAVIAHKVGEQMVVLMDPSEDPEDTLRTHRSREKTFIFDTVFDQHASQEDVYRATTQHLVEGVISGYNATVFAYGPSGAGKTHTMLGMDAEPGIYLQTLTDLFQAIEENSDNMGYRVSMSYLEIYNEVIRDLLNPASGFLDLREDSRGNIQIAGITEASTSNAQEIMQLLTKGNWQRTQEPTATNRTSSRSHAVLQVTVRQWGRGAEPAEEVRVGRLFMVALAGSERASQTQNRGKRMKEGAHINRSLLALGNCINALSEKGGSRVQYVNFRDSKLTRLLKDALGGNSRTVMIAHVSPASTSFEESRTTLTYAYRAKNIKTQDKRNLLSVSFHIAQYTDVISDLHREIEHLKAKLERQEKEKLSEPRVQDAPATAIPHGGRGHLQMDMTRAQLIGAFEEQMETRRSLVGLESTNVELHMDTSCHLLTIADWERKRTQQQARREGSEAKEGPAEVDTEGEEPPEVALAREELNTLLAEQRKAATLKVGLEQRLAEAKRKASQMEGLLPGQAVSEDQREVLRLLCRAHELEVGSTELRADNLYRKNLLCQKDFVIWRYQQHRLLCEQLMQEQQQLIRDAGIPVPEPLDSRYRLYSRELGEGLLHRLLLLHALTCGLLRDGSVPSTPPLPGDPSRDQPDDRKALPWGAQFELPLMLLETDSDSYGSSKATPSKTPGKQDSQLPLSSFCILPTPPMHEKRSSTSTKSLGSKLCSPEGLHPSTPRPALSPQALKEMALSTRSIALLAASQCSRHPPGEGAPDTERMARRTRAPSLPGTMQPVTEKLQSPSVEHLAESQLPPALLQPSKSGKSFFPAFPSASKIKPSLSLHADENLLHVPEVRITFPRAVWPGSAGPGRGPLLPRDIRGSTDSGGQRHSPLPPSTPRKQQGGSAKKARRPR